MTHSVDPILQKGEGEKVGERANERARRGDEAAAENATDSCRRPMTELSTESRFSFVRTGPVVFARLPAQQMRGRLL